MERIKTKIRKSLRDQMTPWENALKIRWQGILTLCLALLLVTACQGPSLPTGFDEAKVLAQAKTVVTQLNSGDFTAVEAQYSDGMKAALPAGGLKNALAGPLANLGAFQEFKSSSMGSGENPQAGKYAVVVLKAAYEKGETIYTISIDASGRLTGLYLK